MASDKYRTGFIGIGAMGTPMATHILQAGFPLTVYDRDPGRMQPLLEKGAKGANSPAEVARGSDIVITMIGTVADELEAVLGEGGVLEGAHEGLLLVDMSTVGIVATQKMAAAASAAGVGFLDATVSGSVGPAQEAALELMVGGSSADLERARPLLETMSQRIDHVGPNGAGSAMKAALNLMIGMTVLTIAETLTLGRRAGLNPDQMLEILGRSSVRSPHLERKGRMMIDGDFTPAFALKYMQKDFDLIMEAAHELRLPLFASAIAHQVYTAANVSGFGDEDYAAVVRFLERAAGG